MTQHQEKTVKRSSMRRRSVMTAAALAVTLTVSACSSTNPLEKSSEPQGGGGDGPKIVVGSADFPESEVIANLYAGVLRANGFNASVKAGIGSREVYIKALQDGSVDLMPEYSGNLLAYFDPKTSAKTRDEVSRQLKEKMPQGLKPLSQAQAEDTDALVVTQVTAEKYKLATIDDLGKVCSQLTMGGPAEIENRAGGLKDLEEKYGCSFKSFKPITDGGGPLTVKALVSDQVQVANLFSTSPAIEDNSLVQLKDTKNNWAAQNVLPLVVEKKNSEKLESALNKVQNALTTQDLMDLNRRVSGENKQEPSEAAQQWLKEKGIVP